MAVIETQGLQKHFRVRKNVVEAVRGIDLRVDAGQIFGFLGPNGAGKSTTLRMLSTLLPPSGGTATVVGCDLKREPARIRERIGYVSQSGGADESATGRENLLLQAHLHGIGRAEAQQRVAALSDALELGSFVMRRVKTYSGGQRRRLDIALGMVHRPALLFLDEPTTGLDPQSRARLWDEVRRLRDEGTTIFLTTHYLDEADALCNRLAIIDHGRIVAEGTPTELKQQVAGDVVIIGLERGDHTLQRAEEMLRGETFVREVQVDDAHRSDEVSLLRLYVERGEEALVVILRLLDSAGLSLKTIALTRPTLDDVFLRQTGRSLREDA